MEALFEDIILDNEASNVGMGKLTINLNTIVTTVIGAGVLFVSTAVYNDVKNSSRELDKLTASMPHLQASVVEVKSALAQMVTRAEFEQKQDKTETVIDKLNTEISRLNNDVIRLKYELVKQDESNDLKP